MFGHNGAGGRAADEPKDNSVKRSTKVVPSHKGDIVAFQNIDGFGGVPVNVGANSTEQNQKIMKTAVWKYDPTVQREAVFRAKRNARSEMMNSCTYVLYE